MKIVELLAEAIAFLGKDKLLEAEILLAFAISESREYLLTHKKEEVEDNYARVFRDYLRRFSEGESIAYIVCGKEFYGLDFYVDNRVLVPRPETEQIVERAITFLTIVDRGREKIKILDMGTGSGNIAISIVKACEDLPIYADAVDVSDEACEVAVLNVEKHGLSEQIDVFASDLFENIEYAACYDVIVANLPYIGEKKNRFVEKNVEKFEPNVALFGGECGLELYEEMFLQMIEKNIGFDLMIGEFGFAQGEQMADLLDKYFDERWKIVPDLAGIERIFIVKGE